MKRRNKGFTLVELLAVIIILALIMLIAIPAVVSTMRAAQKESFYLYAQSLQSKAIAKYTQDLEHDKKNTDCAIYDIGSDLGLSNTGEYEGWVKVSRKSSQSGKRNIVLTISNSTNLLYVKYCIAEGNTCTPNTSFAVPENTKTADITKTLDNGDVMCANYQYVENNTLKTAKTTCKTYADGHSTTDTYTYEVLMTLKDRDYAVENLIASNDMSEDEFYSAIADFNATHKNSANKLAIDAPSCSASSDETKGTTTTKTTKVTTTTTTTRGSQEVTTTTTTKKSTGVTTTTTKKPGIHEVTTTTTTRGTQEVTTTTTEERSTAPTTTTTIDVKDHSLLLSSLNISGYDIGFDPLKFYYTMRVPNSQTSLSVSAIALEPQNSTVEIIGADALNVGSNPVVIVVYNPTTNKKAYYNITVKRLDTSGNEVNENEGTTKPPHYNTEEGKPDPTLEASNAALSYLAISGYMIDFNPEVYEYTVTTKGEKNLFINYRTASEKAIVSLSGNEELNDGDQIVLYVQSQNGYYHKTYTINVEFQKQDSTTTKVLRGVAVGLGVILLIVGIIILMNKKKKIVTIKRDKDDII